MKIFKRPKIFKNKKAMELSINFIVMLILAIVMFGFGLRFLTTLFAGGQKVQAALDEQTKSKIEALLTSGERVAIPLDTKTIVRGKSELIGLGILNVMSNQSADDFYVRIDCISSICSDTNRPREALEGYKYTIDNNKQQMVKMMFIVPKKAPSGSYTFNVCVARNTEVISCLPGSYALGDLYDKSVHQVHIKVP